MNYFSEQVIKKKIQREAKKTESFDEQLLSDVCLMQRHFPRSCPQSKC